MIYMVIYVIYVSLSIYVSLWEGRDGGRAKILPNHQMLIYDSDDLGSPPHLL